MGPANAIPAHALMRNAESAGHSTRPKDRATQSAFSSYGFGPVDTGKGGKSVSPVSGQFGTAQSSQNMSWISQVQSIKG
jgi:hypothetical protein